MARPRPRRASATAALLCPLALLGGIVLTGCGGGSNGGGGTASTYTIGGTVSGLTGGSISLQDNGGDTTPVSANGPFTFPTQLASGAAYAVTISTQPAGQTCTVAAGSGTVGSANVQSVAVTCKANTYAIGGTVSGLSGGQLTLDDNGADALPVTANGPFTFATQLASGASYTVTVATQPAGQTCSVANGQGTVAGASVTSVAVTCVAVATYAIGGTVSGLSGGQLTLDDNGADALPVTANGAFTFSTKLASGASYAVTVAGQPAGQLCTVSNGTGTVAGADVTSVAVACAVSPPQFAYVANNFDNDVSAYAINPGTGALTAVAGSPFSVPNRGISAVAASNAFVYATTSFQIGNQSIFGWSIASGTGALTTVPGSPYIIGPGGTSITVSPAGTFAYVASGGSNAILAYSIDATTGALTALGGNPFATGSGPGPMAINRTGTLGYVPNSDGTISGYSVDPVGGALTALAGSPFTLTQADALAMTSTFVYATNYTPNTVSAYSVNTTTGALTAVAGSPFATGTGPVGIAVNPAGTLVYVANQAGSISAFTINASSGALTAVAGSPFVAGTKLTGIAIDRTGSFLYVTNPGTANGSNNAYAFSINPTTGALTAVAGSPFPTGINPSAIAIAQP
ncbi:MAG: beta-propeller fold lactonase family protein [Gammaproteobacteria bacterium]|nr:beta-propeller fold lactonase family protein [Gammaproteobacteria bacterium]